MFVIRTGVVAATLGALTLGACTDPAQDTDLRPEGPPDVLAVTVMTDAATQLSEKATFCKLNDEKRPSLVGLPDFTTSQICPEDLSKGVDEVTSAYPDGWFVRIMFDELLDPSIETLTPILDSDGMETGNFSGSIAASHPVTLQCESVNGGMVSVDYDGYYQPAGNRVTWPLGPSLVIKPNNPKLIATNTECTVTINNDVVRDKSGEKVPDNEKGPYKFRTAGISVIAIDPSDDPDSASPIDAEQIYFDNPYVQFNTFVDFDSLCPGNAGDFSTCNDETVFSITDVAHPAEGPGVCDATGTPCDTVADCNAAMNDKLCGRGACAADGSTCNVASDCPTANDSCQTHYAYRYGNLGATEAEFGLGPIYPIETEHKYTMQFVEGAKLKDRCGNETTFGAPSVDNNTLVHFATNKFDFKKTSIVTGETAAANKRFQYNWNNVVEGPQDIDVAAGQFTISPAPQALTAACAAGGAGCPTADIAAADWLVPASDGSGQIMLDGHLKMDTQYTATLKAGTVVKDFYGKMWTNPSDLVVTWKTAAAIQMTGISMRFTGAFVGVGDKGTITKPSPATTSDIRLAFNASMDPTTLDLTDVKVESVSGAPAPTVALASPSGCGSFTANPTNSLGTCSLRLRGLFQPGTYKITLVAGAEFKDIFGATYTQAKDQSITVTIEEAPAPIQCL
jgi:hypothetical protein